MHQVCSERAVRAYIFGEFRIDTSSFQLFHNDAVVALPPKAFDTLLCLVCHRDRTVTKEELLALVWPDSYVTDESLTQIIFILRRVLGDNSANSKFITTISRRGYRFIGEVTEVPELILPKPTPRPEVDPVPDAVAAPVPLPIPRQATELPAPVLSGSLAPVSTRRMLAIGAGILVVGGLILGSMFAMRKVRAASDAKGLPIPVRFNLPVIAGLNLVSGGLLSPDGKNLAFTAMGTHSDQTQLWVRPLNATEPRLLAGTEGASSPFWSPDSHSLGFFAKGRLKRIALEGGGIEPITVLSRTEHFSVGYGSGSWGPRDLILFSGMRTPLFSVAATGGTPVPITSLDSAVHESGHHFPQLLPDGRHFIYYSDSEKSERNGTYLGVLGSKEATRILEVPSFYAQPGFLLYIRDNMLVARGFDVATLRLSGETRTIANNVIEPDHESAGIISASDNGILSFVTASGSEHLLWFDRAGERMGAVESSAILRNPTLFAGDKQLVAADGSRTGLWLVNLERSTVMRWGSSGMRPVPTADGSQVAFTSDRISGVADIFLGRTLTSGEEDHVLLSDKENKMVCGWSPDGRYLVYASLNPQTQEDLWLLPRFGDGKPIPYLRTPFNEAQAQVLPDGHWIAYTSDESGDWNVYVQSFPVPGSKQVISTTGGTEPHWRGDGGELFYISSDQSMMSVETRLGSTLQVKSPTKLFHAPLPARPTIARSWYSVTGDGKRFIIDARGTPGTDAINVIANWPLLVRP